MVDHSRLVREGRLNSDYLREWCTRREGEASGDPARGFGRLALNASGGRAAVFWLLRLGAGQPGRPWEARWQGDGFCGSEAYLPEMLAVLLACAAGTRRRVEINISGDGSVPGGIDPRAMHYFLLPTGFNLVLAHKGEYEAEVVLPRYAGGQRTYEEENSFLRRLEEILAPRHPIYPVGPEAPDWLRAVFLIGHRRTVLQSLVRTGAALVLTYVVESFPADGPAEVAAHLESALREAGRSDGVVTARCRRAGGRSGANIDDLGLLHRGYLRAFGRPPEVEWLEEPSLAGLFSRLGLQTAAFGPGTYRDGRYEASPDPEAGRQLATIIETLLA